MSLRARLLALLVALAALALVVLAAVTYAEQRSFLMNRAQDEALGALPAVNHRLEPERGAIPGPGGAPFGGPPPGDGGTDGGGPRAFNLPTGVYGQRRDANGDVTATVVLVGYGQSRPAAPKLPGDLTAGRTVTVDSVDGSGPRYLVRAFATGDLPGTTLVAVPLGEADSTLHRLLGVEALVIAAVLLALGVLAWWLVKLGLRPLDRMGRTADAIAAGDLSRRVSPADGRTEVGRLGLALNGMLAQIEHAFAERRQSENRLRRFLADASHELRTPLASIRGYAELFRLGAVRDEEETEKAIGRIEHESARMGALVEDLLTLARLDQLPEASRRPVDLGELLRDAADDARAAAPEREIAVDAGDRVTVLGDSSQLRQVIGNLTRNALVHTPAGTPVELRLATDGPSAVIDVRDHGPGLPSEDPAELFERFWRASDPGRGRGPAGAGLGLSIVAAIVDAHGGEVRAETADGGGARFTIRLPLEHAHAPSAPPAAPASA